MAQISKGDTFTNGEQVTGARLNQLVDSSVLLVGAITDQPSITAGTLEATDSTIVNDAGTLKETTIGDILGSSLPILASTVTATSVITPALNAGANSDVVVTPYDGAVVTGKTFTSADGVTAVITSIAHGLATGMVVDITASNTAYSGQYSIIVSSVDTFSYSVYPTTTAASGTCSYTRKATERVIGNLSVLGGQYVAGNDTIGGNLRVIGTATIGGKTPMTTQDNLVKTYVKYASVSGITSPAATINTIYTLPTLPTIPADETWVYEFSVMIVGGYMNGDTRPTNDTPSLYIYNGGTLISEIQGSEGAYGDHQNTFFYSLNGVTGASYILKYRSISNLSEDPRYLIRLTKVKTSTLSDAATCI